MYQHVGGIKKKKKKKKILIMVVRTGARKSIRLSRAIFNQNLDSDCTIIDEKLIKFMSVLQKYISFYCKPNLNLSVVF